MTIHFCGPIITGNVPVNIFAAPDLKLRMPMGHVMLSKFILCAVP